MSWDRCQGILQRIRLAQSRGWHQAAAAVSEELSIPVAQCAEDLKEIFDRLISKRPSPATAALRGIFADLIALVDEFDDVSIVLAYALLAVTTTPVVLEGFDLGRFQVRLYWNRIAATCPYKATALAPNPAHSSEDTTHPHIVDEQLCEGEGELPIARALREGRLLDFFQIVNSLLNTYNPASAYVALPDWYGGACADCGGMVNQDDERNCDGCECVLCGSCVLACDRCDNRCSSECARHADTPC